MVKIKEKINHENEGGLTLETWLQKMRDEHHISNLDLIKRACELAKTTSKGLTTFYGQPCLEQSLEMAEIVLDLKLDETAVASAIMIGTAQQAHLSLEQIEKHLGPKTSKLIHDVQKLSIINTLTDPSQAQTQIQLDRLRKILLAMAADIRAVVIKLAERTVLMRGVKNINPHERKRLAKETMNVYAPLANRLGIGQLKWELEDLSFHYLNPDIYKTIASFIAEKRLDREKRIKQIVTRLKKNLVETGVNADVTGRAKHIYSIYLKQQRKQLDYKNIFDYSAARVLVPTLQDCYTALSVVHKLWDQISDEFDDYISHPKPNGYRSIHTAVIGPDEKTLEIQIRTHEMHKLAEHGVAAHWLYKENYRKTGHEHKITLLRQLLQWEQDITQTQPEKNSAALFADRVYAFTPGGDIIDLPLGATPLDFAYHIHTELGHRCRGAKINGHIVSLKTNLQTGDQVEILTVPQGAPSRDWLNLELGYLKTARAKAKVSQWFRHLEINQPAEPEKQIHGQRQLKKSAGSLPVSLKKSSSPSTGLIISGINSLLTRIARCCKPIPRESIIGYITQGRGVSVHRKDCSNLSRLMSEDQNRLLEVTWDSKHIGGYYVDIFIRAHGRETILKEITNLLVSTRINLISLHSTLNQKINLTNISMTLQIEDSSRLKQLMTQIKQFPDIIEVTRPVY
jgi:GTP pyrophosphokinase